MSFLLNKVIKVWNTTKDTSQMIAHETPVGSPPPNLSHLTQDEIRAIRDVILRQAEFERQEANRIKKLREEVDSLQQELSQRSRIGAKDKKSADVRLCRLCFKTKFDDGMGRICEDCQQRVCKKCGVFSSSRWGTGKSERKWRCKLCNVRREMLCCTGGWYHGPPADAVEELKKQLSIASNPEEIQGRDQNQDENKCHPSGNRTDSELVRNMTGYQKSRTSGLSKHPRRQSLLPDSGGIVKRSDNMTEDDDDDKNSPKMFILERQMSRRKRQEKRQRRRRKSVSIGVKKSPSFDENKGDSADCSGTNSSICSSFSDSSKSNEVLVQSPASPASTKVILQNTKNLNDCTTPPTDDTKFQKVDRVSRGSVQLQRKTTSEPLEARPIIKVPQTKGPDMIMSKDSAEKSMQKWRQSGFPNVYPILLHWLPRGCPFGLQVIGGFQDVPETTRALVTWVSSEIKASVHVGQEVLEWNGEALRGQTYDNVISVTSHVCPRALILVNPSIRREDRHAASDGHSLITEDDPSNQTTELQGKRAKLRMLPKTPNEIKQGEIQFKLHYQTVRSELSVTVLKARHIVEAGYNETRTSGVFVTVNLVPGKSARASLETETSHSLPEWNKTFVLGGVSMTEMVSRALQLTVWRRKENCDLFLGEVLLDLAQAPLDGQPHWYSLEDHDENSSPLPQHRSGYSANKSANLTSHSFKDSTLIFHIPLPDAPSHRNSPTSTGSSCVSPVPFGTSQNGSKEFHVNNMSQPVNFTRKMRKTVRKTVSKMSPLSLIEKKDNAGSDDSISSEKIRKLSSRSDKSVSSSKSQNLQKPAQNLNLNLDLLAPPQPLSRSSSCSSLFMSDDEDISGQCSMSALSLDRPPTEGEDDRYTLGPGQIPAKASTKTTLCGDVKLGFMVSKGQLQLDIICASGLHWDGHVQLPDTYAKTYLMEGKKVIQSKKTTVVKATSDPVYCKRIKYLASNIHGRLMKIAIWRRTSSFDKKVCLGELLVRLDALDLSKPTVAWYKLFQRNSMEYGSDEYLNFW